MEEKKRDFLFSGTFSRTLDEKNRLAIPARLRSQLEKAQSEDEVIYVFCHPGSKVIRIYTYDSWMNFAQSIIDEIKDPIKRSDITDAIYSLLEEQKIDSQGRIPINKDFAKLIGLEKNAVVKGMGRSIQIKPEVDVEKKFEFSDEQNSYIDKMLI